MVDKTIRIHSFCIGLSIILFPFISSIQGIPALGWLGKEASFYPLAIGATIWTGEILKKQAAFYYPAKQFFTCLMIFLLIVILSGVINLSNLWGVTFNNKSGISIWFMQTMSLMVYIWLSVYVYNWALRYKNYYPYIYKCIIVSIGIAGGYSFFELCKILGNDIASQVILFIDSIFRDTANETIFNYGRIRSVASEASYFGMYSGIIMPWLCSTFFGAKKYMRILILFLLIYFTILNIMSVSRTAYFIFAIESVIYIVLLKNDLEKVKIWFIMYLLFCALALFVLTVSFSTSFNIDITDVFLSLFDDSAGSFSSSNNARLGSQLAAVYIFEDNPILGVGFGTAGLYLADYYPAWALHEPEVQIWIQNVISQSSLISSHCLYVRLLAETGVLGLVGWIGYFYFLIKNLLHFKKEQTTLKERIMVSNVVVTIIGLMLFAFNIDAFRLMPYWVLFGLSWVIARDSL